MVTSGVEGRAEMHSSERRWFFVLYRVAFALLAIAAMAYQLIESIRDDRSAVNFFSFFTIQSNIIAAGLLLYTALRAPDGVPSRTLDLLRGAAVLYMTTTGIVYALLLSGEDVQTTIGWVNTVVHQIIPIVVVLDWLLDPPRTRLTWRKALVWLSFPLVWVIYTLIRGPIVDWYPYPFLDPDHPDAGSWGRVFVNCVAIAIGILALTWVVVAVGNKMRTAFGSGGR
ncbi:MAG: Pr6Pr family membrane protein [Thermomicrobiales bacterium]